MSDDDLSELGVNIKSVRKRILELVDAIKRDGIVLVPTKGEGAVDTAALAAAMGARHCW